MGQGDLIEMSGVVREVLPNAMFRIAIEGGHEVLGYLAGRLRRFRIRVLAGDNVLIELSPYDLKKGRISRRL